MLKLRLAAALEVLHAAIGCEPSEKIIKILCGLRLQFVFSCGSKTRNMIDLDFKDLKSVAVCSAKGLRFQK